jgi:hypothetical protein
MAYLLVNFAYAYSALGLLVAALFLVFGLDRIDQAARGSFAFRPLLVPGLVLLWPLVLLRWRQRLGS